MDLTTGSGTSTRGVHTAEPPSSLQFPLLHAPGQTPPPFTPTKGPPRRSPTHRHPHAAARGAGPEPAIRWPAAHPRLRNTPVAAPHRCPADLPHHRPVRVHASCSHRPQKNRLQLTHQPNWTHPARPERLAVSREPPHSTGTEPTPHTPSLHSVVPITSTRVTRRGEPRGLTQVPVAAWLPGQTGKQVPQADASRAATNGPRR